MGKKRKRRIISLVWITKRDEKGRKKDDNKKRWERKKKGLRATQLIMWTIYPPSTSGAPLKVRANAPCGLTPKELIAP